jgi:segregation and condensation protein A
VLLEAYLGLSERARNEKPINAKLFQPIVSYKVVSVGSKIVYILKKLYTVGVCDLSHIYDGMRTKSERVATFLAILELTKSGRICLNDDNTQISFSERSLERKKHPKGEAAASDAEKAEQEQTAPKPDDDEEKEGGEQHQPAAAQTLQQIPEFKPDESVHMPPEPKSEQAEKPKTHIKQATERIAYNDPPVLALPMMAFVQTDTAAQAEQTPTEDKPEPTAQVEQTPTEEKTEQTAQIEQTPIEDKPEPIVQVEEIPTEELHEPITLAQEVSETPILTATEYEPDDTLPQVSDSEEISGVPFKPNYWCTVRYYWGKSPVGDDAPRNYWRYGSARM